MCCVDCCFLGKNGVVWFDIERYICVEFWNLFMRIYGVLKYFCLVCKNIIMEDKKIRVGCWLLLMFSYVFGNGVI